MNRWIDVTRRLDERLVCWPGRKPPDVAWDKRVERGDHCNVSSWRLVAHTGTHVDAPLHFVKGGTPIDEVPLETLMGPATVVDIRGGARRRGHRGQQTLAADQARRLGPTKRLLIRTGFGESGRFTHHPELLSVEAAEVLLKGGLCLLGTDRLSVDDSRKAEFSIHHLLLNAGCVIIEGLNLSMLRRGPYELCALPLRMGGAEASPARVVVRRLGTRGRR